MIEKLKEIDNEIRKEFAGGARASMQDVIILWDKINEIIEELNKR